MHGITRGYHEEWKAGILLLTFPFFVDLDGTIIGPWSRYYSVYCDISQDMGIQSLNFFKFVEIRREGIPTVQLLPGINEKEKSFFLEQWYSFIELKEYLVKDRLFPRARAALSHMEERGRLVIITLRTHHANLLDQVRDLSLGEYFDTILRQSPVESPQKAPLIRRYCYTLPEFGYIIGDSETDVLAGRGLNIPTISVKSGIRSRDFLSGFLPDYVISGIWDIGKIVR